MILIRMYSFRCSYVLRTFLLFPFFFLRWKREMEKQKLLIQDTMKAIHKTKTSAIIIKHSIIHINMYLEKGMNVVFIITRIRLDFRRLPCPVFVGSFSRTAAGNRAYTRMQFSVSFSFCAFLLCIACIPFLFFRKLVSTEVYYFCSSRGLTWQNCVRYWHWVIFCFI